MVVDNLPFLKTDIPPPLQYPVRTNAFAFCKALCHTFFGLNAFHKSRGLGMLVKALVVPQPGSTKRD